MAQDFTDDCFAGVHGAQADMQKVENNFAAVKSTFSGPDAPSNPVAGMSWFDMVNEVIKQRNAANNAWLVQTFPPGTVALFGQASAPIGWTKKTTWSDNAMLCINTQANGTALDSDGSANPQSAHTHTDSHTHTGPSHSHTGVTGGPSSTVGCEGLAGGTPTYPGSQIHTHALNADGTGNTGDRSGSISSNTAPLYQEVIAATKD